MKTSDEHELYMVHEQISVSSVNWESASKTWAVVEVYVNRRETGNQNCGSEKGFRDFFSEDDIVHWTR